MITALRLVPWLQAQGKEGSGPPYNCNAQGEYNCGRDHDSKCRLHCGWLDESEWIGDELDVPVKWVGMLDHEASRVDISDLKVCPGYLVRLPGLADVGKAYAALEKGSLETYYPEPSNALLDAAMSLGSAYNAHSDALMQESMRKNR